MKKQNREVSEAALLRILAEDKLKSEVAEQYAVDEVDRLKLIHELQVHQIELEMQNEELELSKEKITQTVEKYTELYDFAPSGYISLSREGDIESLNFSAAKLLGNDRNKLINTRFGLYIHPENKIVYNQTLGQTLRSASKRSLELYLLSKSIIPIYVHIDVLFSENTNQYFLTIIDITAIKQLEIELENSLLLYKKLNGFYIDRELKMVDLKKEINDLLVQSGNEIRY